ncbi:GntR family transcriptional regulator [Spelaeicoccus albus]|uniref:DNA-binding GntR family transcriptional regulator n=1 Tax=Spelaeicoccus albus TaxID=1280376 RepID=A0A7Z0ABF4_9MICO|nr:GntR family transcriptional regulator [Spelaeicoccus albus]NYI67113.1 DNA-binding GntR family transcriptional regulator [Spelaeicoccus albus]
MSKRGSSATKTQAVFDRLHSDITSGRLTAGERLSPEDLKARLGVSVSVIREALTQLVAQGLVQVEHNRGFHVKNLSIRDVVDLMYARKINECAALRLAVERHDLAWESEVLAAHHVMAGLSMYAPNDPAHRNDKWARAHTAFHQKLFEGCRNDTLIDICRKLSESAELYRGWTTQDAPDSEAEVAANHKQLLDAVLARDADLTVELHTAHLQRTIDIMLARAGEADDADVAGEVGTTITD